MKIKILQLFKYLFIALVLSEKTCSYVQMKESSNCLALYIDAEDAER